MGWEYKDKDNVSNWKSSKAFYLKIQEPAGCGGGHLQS